MFHATRTVLLLVFGATHGGLAPAADWKPEKNIEIVVGVTLGGPADTSARMLQKIMQEKRMVAVPVSVTNRPGANNALAWIYINQHSGDGHYLAMTLPNIVTNRLTGTHELNYTEVTPLAQLNSEYIVFSVKSDSPSGSRKSRKTAGNRIT